MSNISCRSFGWVVLLMCSLVTVQPVWGLDLLQAYRAALEQDATIRAAEAASRAQRERLPQAKAQLLPNLGFSSARNYNDQTRTQANLLGVPTTTSDQYFSFNHSLTLRQPLFRKQLWLGLEQAEQVVLEADATLEREVQNLGIRVTGAYLEALLAQDQLTLTLKQKTTTALQLEAATKALRGGTGTRTDIDEAQARLDMTVAQELEAKQHVEFTRRQLEVLINRPVDGLASVDESRVALVLPVPPRLEDWLALAEGSSPELLALKARLESARLEVEKAQSGHYPTLDAVAQVVRSASENVTSPGSSYTNRTLGFQLNVPLYAGGYVNSTVRQAQAEQARVEETLEVTRRDLGVRLHREFRGVTEGVLKVKALEQAVRSAEQVVKSNRRSFEAGSRTVLDILNAEQQWQTAVRDLAQARYMYLVSWVRLQALAGGDKEKAIVEVNNWLQTSTR